MRQIEKVEEISRTFRVDYPMDEETGRTPGHFEFTVIKDDGEFVLKESVTEYGRANRYCLAEMEAIIEILREMNKESKEAKQIVSKPKRGRPKKSK